MSEAEGNDNTNNVVEFDRWPENQRVIGSEFDFDKCDYSREYLARMFQRIERDFFGDGFRQQMQAFIRWWQIPEEAMYSPHQSDRKRFIADAKKVMALFYAVEELHSHVERTMNAMLGASDNEDKLFKYTMRVVREIPCHICLQRHIDYLQNEFRELAATLHPTDGKPTIEATVSAVKDSDDGEYPD